MAKENKPEETNESILTTAAKKLGSATGKIAAALGATPEASGSTTAPSRAIPTKMGQLPKKNKSRLPRREKKARQKAGTLQAQ